MMNKIIATSILGLSSQIFAHGFVAGTQVKTPFGSKSIEDIKKGDLIIACDFFNCTTRQALSDATEMGVNAVFEISDNYGNTVHASEHQEFNTPAEPKSWNSVRFLQNGTFLRINGFQASQIESKAELQPQMTYGFEVEKDHDFYAEGFLVHNWGDNNGGNGGNGGNCSGDNCNRGGDGGSGGSGGSSTSSDGGSGNGNGNGSANGNGSSK